MAGSYGVRLSDNGGLGLKLLHLNQGFLEAQRRIVAQATGEVRAAVVDRAPGSLGSHVTAQTGQGGGKVWGRVACPANPNPKRGSDFRYAFALDAWRTNKGPPRRRPRYRGGPHAGNLTYRWFRGARTGVKKRMGEQQKAAVRDVLQGVG